MIISVIACPGEGRGHDLAVRRPRCRHRGGDRAMHEAPPPSGVPALLANHRPPHPAETRSPPRARQLCHPQACHPQACQGDGMARQAPALSPALHPDLGIVAQPSRALLRLDHSSPHPARCLHLGARTRSGHPRLPRPSQCPPQALRLDKIGRGNPCQSQPRASHPGNRRERESSDKLSTLAANAGVYEFAALGEITEEHFDRTFNTNVRGLLFAMQKALPLLTKGSSVILTGSMVSIKGFPSCSVYNASKAAIRSFARGWIVDLKGRDIRVNVLSPGYTATPGLSHFMTDKQKAEAIESVPLGRIGTPDDLGKAAVFLASDDSAYVTGIELFVDGGVAQI